MKIIPLFLVTYSISLILSGAAYYDFPLNIFFALLFWQTMLGLVLFTSLKVRQENKKLKDLVQQLQNSEGTKTIEVK